MAKKFFKKPQALAKIKKPQALEKFQKPQVLVKISPSTLKKKRIDSARVKELRLHAGLYEVVPEGFEITSTLGDKMPDFLRPVKTLPGASIVMKKQVKKIIPDDIYSDKEQLETFKRLYGEK